MRNIIIGLIALPFIVLAGAAIAAMLIPSTVYQEQIETAASEALGREVTIAGPVKVGILPRIEAQAGNVTIANASGFTAASFAEVQDLRARLNILPLFTGRIEVAEFVLVEPTLSLETLADGRSNWTFDTMAAEGAAQTSSGAFKRTPGAIGVDASFGDVRLENGSARFIDRASGAEHELADINIAIGLDSLAKPLVVDGGFTLDGLATTVDVRLETLKDFLEGRRAPLKAKITSDALTLAFDGAFTESEDVEFAGRLSVESPSLRGLAAIAGAELPPGDGVYERFSLKGEASASPQAASFTNAELAFDAIRARGDAAISLSGARPKITGTFDVGALNVNPYLPQASTEAAQGGEGDGGWSEEPIDLAPLELVDADLTLNVGPLTFDKLVFDRAAMTAVVNNGRLQADLTDLSAYGASGTMQVVANARSAQPGFAIKADLDGLSAQPFLKAAANFVALEGLGTARLDITTKGTSVADVMRGLNGGGKFAFREGTIAGVDLAEAARSAEALTRGEFSLTAFGPSRSTAFSDLIGAFKLNNGVAELDELTLSTDGATVSGGGALDIGGQSMSVTLAPQLTEGDLAGLPVPLKLSGAWGDVSFNVDSSALSGAIAARAQAELVDEAQDLIDRNLDGAAGDLVRGVFGLPSRDDENGEEGAEGDAEAAEEDDAVADAIRSLFGQ